jgi:hypothetical protein
MFATTVPGLELTVMVLTIATFAPTGGAFDVRVQPLQTLVPPFQLPLLLLVQVAACTTPPTNINRANNTICSQRMVKITLLGCMRNFSVDGAWLQFIKISY